MTKKHYEAMATIIKEAYDKCPTQNTTRYDDIVYPLADYFATDNPKFDRERFLTACGITK